MVASPLHVRVAIVGGGATGAMIAWHFLRARSDLGANALAIIEPRARLGAGQAYGSNDPEHRINVPASRMSIDTQTPEDFSTWLDRDALEATDPDAFLPSGDIYPSRATFGIYLAARLEPEQEAGRLRHIRDSVTSIRKISAGWVIKTDGDTQLVADAVVIATSHPAPSLPKPLRTVANDPRVVANPWVINALDDLAPDARLVIVGTGLTMADVVASATAHGHHGPIIAFSRRGLRARGHASTSPDPLGDFTTQPARTARELLNRIRAVLASHPDRPWQDVLDAVRKQGRALWAALSMPERKRLIRHLRPFWDVHRFRVAPQIEQTVDRRLSDSTLQILAARLEDAEANPSAIRLTIHPRGGTTTHIEADRVINTTGPNHAGILAVPYLHGLAQGGFVEADPVGLGLHTTFDHRALARGVAQDRLFIAGPLSRGTFGELMGLPEVTANAESVARLLASDAVTPHQHSFIEA